MESKNMIGGIVSLAVVVICVAAIMMPVLEEVKLTAGAKVTLENTMHGNDHNYTIWDGSDIEFEFTYVTDSSTYTINGEDVTSDILNSIAPRIVLASNVFASRNAGSSGNNALNNQYIDSTTSSTYSFTFRVTDKVYTITTDSDTYTGDLEWLVYADPDGTANLGQINDPSSTFYTGLNDNLIVLGNIYTTGENDTFYSYYNGDLSVNSTYQDDSSVTITQTLADGYTDIYNTTLTVNVGEESFTPYYILTPEEVTGHEASGAAYSLYGAIPIIVIAAIVVASIGMVVTRRD